MVMVMVPVMTMVTDASYRIGDVLHRLGEGSGLRFPLGDINKAEIVI